MKTTTQNIRKSNKWAALALACALMMAALAPATAQNPYPPYDFSQANSDGDTLYYRITSNTAPYTVAVTRCHDSVYHTLPFPSIAYEVGMPGFVYPVYDYDSLVVIPASVTHNGVTYTVTSIDKEAFYMQKNLGTVILPTTIDTIFIGAFYRSTLSHIEMPNVRFVDDGALGNTSLENISLPSSLTWLGCYAFFNSNLQSVDIPGSVKVLPEGCFMWCPLQHVVFHEGLERIEQNAFDCMLVDSLVFPASLTYLALSPSSEYISNDATFSLSYVEIPNGSTPLELGKECFAHFTNLHSITLPNRVTKLGRYCFADSGLESIVVPTSVQSIPRCCFIRCLSLHHVKLPDGLERIDTLAFSNDPNLQEITIPASVLNIAVQAFVTAASASVWHNRTFNFEGTLPPVVENYALGAPGGDTLLINIPCHTTADFQTGVGWNQYASASTATFHEVCTGVENCETEDIMLYPNPVHSMLTVEIPSGEAATIELYDMFGKLVLTQSAEDTSTDISMANLPAGLYLLQLTFPNGKQITRKVVKD